MANVIYRGPVSREPETINLPVAGAYTPGVFVTSDGDEFTVADGVAGRLLLLSNRRFYDQGPDAAYESGDTGVAYRLETEQEYTAQFAAGTYAKGDALTVNATGQMVAATAGDIVVAFYDGAGAELSAGDRDDIVIASRYTVPE